MASRKEQLQSELLVLRHREGDDRALPELVAMWERPLFYYIRRLVDSEEDAWDLLQDVWCRVLQKIRTLRDSAAFPAWLYTIARNIATDHLRGTTYFSELSKAEAELNSVNNKVEPSLSAFDAEELHSALGRVSLPHREVLTLHFLEGFSLKEIAAIVEAPVGTIKSRLHHAKRALRAVLEKEEEHHE